MVQNVMIIQPKPINEGKGVSNYSVHDGFFGRGEGEGCGEKATL